MKRSIKKFVFQRSSGKVRLDFELIPSGGKSAGCFLHSSGQGNNLSAQTSV